jgi:transcription initiation factor TFIIIB Brf1 subunit/transcription initiation factor TFIIB
VGGSIYFACLLLGVPKDIKDIAAKGVNKVTIKRMYRLY